MPEAMAAVLSAFVLSSRGQFDQPNRIGLNDGTLLVMPAKALGGSGASVKIVTITPENRRRRPTIQAVVVWFDA